MVEDMEDEEEEVVGLCLARTGPEVHTIAPRPPKSRTPVRHKRITPRALTKQGNRLPAAPGSPGTALRVAAEQLDQGFRLITPPLESLARSLS